jgi:hypothetical protein
MIKKILLACLIAAPTTMAFADGERDDGTAATSEDSAGDTLFDRGDRPEARTDCSYYDGSPNGCRNLWYCEYNYAWNRCQNIGGGGGQPRQCWSYDNDPWLCNQQPNCQYDQYARRCEDVGGGGGGGGSDPNNCYRWSHDPYSCEQAYGCFWDNYDRTCRPQGGGGGGGGGGTVTTTIDCGSHNYGYKTCPVYGQIVSVRLIRQLSSARCTQNQTWGSNWDGVWVDRGCRGQFRVTYRRN